MTQLSTGPLSAVALSSVRFAVRRAAATFARAPMLETLIVDIDRTITREDSPKFALERLCGKEKAKEIFDNILRDVVRGRMGFGDIHGAVFGELYSRGFKRSDWGSMMEILEREGGFRKSLIGLIQEMSAREGFTPVLATRSSREGAKWIARRFGFPFAVGSEENVNGTFLGFSTAIGIADGDINGTRIVTKITAASEVLEAAGASLDRETTVVLSNDLLDALEMLASSKGILLVPQEPNTLERLTRFFKLYDRQVFEGPALEVQLRYALCGL